MTNTLTGQDVAQGELSEGWLLSTIGEQCEVVAGSTPKSAVGEYWGGDIAWLTPKDLSQNPNQFVECGERSITESGYESCSTRLVPAGSVLFTSRAPIGYVAIAANEMCTNQGFKTAVPGSGLQSEFLYWQLQHVTPDIRSRASGTTFPEISGKKFAATEIVVPPLAEQARIVEILEEQLSRLETALENVCAVREKAAQFRRSLLHAAFTGALTGHDDDPRNVDFGTTFEVVTEGLRKLKRSEYESEGQIPIIDQGEPLIGGYTSDSSLEFQGPLPVVLFGDHTRRTKFVDFPFALGADGIKILRPRSDVDARFAYFHLEATEIRDRGYARHFSELRKALFWVPPLPEQGRIVEILEEQLSRLDASLAAADAVEERSAALRRSLLHSAFTGRLTRQWREAVNV